MLPTARDVMSAPIRSIDPDTTIAAARQAMLRYGHSGLPIVDRSDRLVGIISRRDVEIASHHGFDLMPVQGWMTTKVSTVTPATTLSELEALMVTDDIGRLPVVAEAKLVGIVTRTDVLRGWDLHRQLRSIETTSALTPSAGDPSRLDFAVDGLTLPTPPDRGDGGGSVKTDSNTNRMAMPLDLDRLQDKLTPQLWTLLQLSAQTAAQWGWQLYLVGGAVRDLLLADATGKLAIVDIDLVVDGFHQAADVGAGVKLATALQEVYPSARLEIHGAFQTAALLWEDDPELGSLGIDIATARTEFYSYPAANPEVEASSIRQDLYRRDFTINAMALRLTPAPGTPLLDFFGGVKDLDARQIRVLHPNSFIEDPTRIYRGARFAVRLGFEIETQTEGFIRYAIVSGVYERTARAHPKTPALQTRLKAELKYLLETSYWQPILLLLSDLGALQCIHPTLKLDRDLLQQLRLLERCVRRFDTQQQLVSWQIRLEAIIAALEPAYRQPVAKNLQLPAESRDRLQNLELAQTEIVAALTTSPRISQVVRLLRQYDLPTLGLITARCHHLAIVRRQIWRYLTVWARIQPILDGNDLRQLGYKPGPQYREILDNLLAATLDGEVTDRASAVEFVRRGNL